MARALVSLLALNGLRISEALGADVTFQTAVKVTKPGGTISNTGYYGEGEFVRITDEEMRNAVDQMTQLALRTATGH